jgi:hypothetical protein
MGEQSRMRRSCQSSGWVSPALRSSARLGEVGPIKPAGSLLATITLPVVVDEQMHPTGSPGPCPTHRR